MSRGCLLVMSLLLAATTARAEENCFKYIEVPPRVLDCDPYVSKLKLLCNVTGPMDSSYEILWFYQGENTLDSTATCESDQSGMLTSVLEVNPSSGSFIGEYYCQVRLGNGSWLEPSQSLMQDLTEAVIQVQGFDDCTSDPLSDMSDDICVGFAESTANNSIAICSFVPEPTPSLPPATTRNTPTSDDITTTHSLASTPTPPDMETPGKSNGLEVWLYVVVAVAAVFAMIIIVLAILCVGLCLRKSQTIDLETLKKQEQRSSGKHFTSTGNSLIPNGAYLQRDTESQDAFANSTLHSQSITVPGFSDYNILGERDYEVIDIGEAKQDYHRLQRPPALPLDRRFRSTLGSTSIKSAGVQSSSTIVATNACSTSELMRGNGLITGCGGEVEVADAGARNMTAVGLPVSFLEHNDSRAELLPDDIHKLKSVSEASGTLDSDVHESLYSTNALPAQPFYHALEKVPETGTMFPEPGDPTAFPVHEYEYVPSTLGVYETPVPSKKNSAISIPDMVDTMQSHATSTATPTDAELINTPLHDIAEVLSSLELGSSVSGSCTARSNGFSTTDFTGTCTAESSKCSTADFSGTAESSKCSTADFSGMSQDSHKSLCEFDDDVQEFTLQPSHNHTTATEVDIEAENDNTETSDFTGPIIFPHMMEARESHTHPQRRSNHYKQLDPSTLEPMLKYTKLKLGKKTLV